MSWKPLLEHPLFRLETRMADGPRGPFPVTRMATQDYVNVLPITPRGEMVLVRQYRYGIEEDSLEIPGGLAERGEDPLAAAKRELREETGFGGGRWSSLGVVTPNPAIQDNRCFLFLAEDVVIAGEQEPDPTESIRVEMHVLRDARHLIDSGAIHHALAVVSIMAWLLKTSDPGTPGA